MFSHVSSLRNVVGIAALVGLGILWETCRPTRIDGESMSPTFRRGDIVFVNYGAYRTRKPDRSDVVIITYGDESMIKRVVGIPGDRIAINRGKLWINDCPWEDPYSVSYLTPFVPDISLARDRYFVIGDNRDDTWYGKVKIDEIKGRVYNNVY